MNNEDKEFIVNTHCDIIQTHNLIIVFPLITKDMVMLIIMQIEQNFSVHFSVRPFLIFFPKSL